jgi:hypothetical protein
VKTVYFAAASTFLYLLTLSKQANSQMLLSAAQCLSYLAALYLICASMPFLPPMYFTAHAILVIVIAALGVRHVRGMLILYCSIPVSDGGTPR